MRRVSLVSALALVSLSALPSIARAQSLRGPLREGDPILGLGYLERIDALAAVDSGVWFAQVESDAQGTPEQPARDGAILRNGFVTLREGALLAEPAGARVASITAFDVDAVGNLALILELEGAPTQGIEDGGIYVNSRPILLRGAAVPGLATELPLNDLYAVRFESSDTLLALVGYDDPDVAGSSNRAWIRFQLGEDHEVLDAGPLVREDETLEGVPRPVRRLPDEPHTFATDGHGNVLMRIAQAGSQLGDTVVVYDRIALVRESQPAPVPGRIFADLGSTRVDLNGRGQLAFTALLEATTEEELADDELLLRGQAHSPTEITLEVFAREGDVLPALEPYALVTLGGAPVLLSETGDLFWYARTSDPLAGRNEVYLRNRDVLVRKGDMTADGLTITGLRSQDHAMAVSPDGRFFVAEVVLEGHGESVLYVDLGRLAPVEGCTAPAATLTVEGGLALAGGTLSLALQGAQAPGSLPSVLFTARRLGPAGGCGLDLGFGEILIRPPVVHTVSGPATFDGGSRLEVALPPDPVLVETSWTFQGLFLDPAPEDAAPSPRLTGAWEMTVGAP